MSCRDYEHYIQLYVDQEISDADRRKLIQHTRSCPECRRELKEMVALVSSLEDVGHDMRAEPPLFFRGFFKWVAVCTVAISFAYITLPLNQNSYFAKSGDPAAQPMQHSVLVLAGKEEPLHIPRDESVHVVRPGKMDEEAFKSEATLVYPSAISFFTEEDYAWSEHTKQFVFVRVPDEETLKTLLTYAGAKVDQLSGLTDLTYPTSFMYQLGDTPQYEAFTFPEEKRDISDLFNQLTGQTPISDSYTPQ